MGEFLSFGVLLDVAVSVLAVMALFSLAASAINEIIADNLVNLRGRTLKRSIRRLLESKEGLEGDGAERVRAFYADPGIRKLKNKRILFGERDPSAIEPRRYALTVLNLLERRRELWVAASGRLEGIRDRTAREIEALGAELGKGAEGAALAADLRALFERDGVRASAAGAAIEEELKRLEEEFNEAMDRVSGWYVRRVRLVLFGIGLFLAVGANIDLLRYADRLMTESSLADRAQMVALLLSEEDLASRVARLSVHEASQGLAGAAAGGLQPVSLGGDARAAAEGAKIDIVAAPGAIDREIERLVASLDRLEVRVGWSCVADGARLPLSERYCGGAGGLPWPSPSQAIGWLIIAIGVTLGAQFWFDLFRRLIRLSKAGRIEDATAA
jgi:hypothetical protein